ncbi:MAG: SDR family NAD(P)-dependent oxidoreductase [Eubacteriaceae bacterium]
MDYDKDYYAGKTAAVTGAASGIGLALCEELLECGAENVTMADFNRDNLERESSRLQSIYPGKVRGVVCDVTQEEQVQNMISQAVSAGNGRLDLLINCAGKPFTGKFTLEPDGLTPGQDFLSKVLTNEDWEKAFDLNFMGPLYGCQAAVPVMISQGGGQIINIISGIAFSPMAYQSPYAATKSALLALSLTLRAELADYKVLVNAATPGTTATNIFKLDGTGEAPPEAQTPHDSASRILHGAADNRRLILGDDSDLDGSRTCFYPDDDGINLDRVYSKCARSRRNGIFDLDFKGIKMISSPGTEIMGSFRIPAKKDIPDIMQKIRDYESTRDADNLNSDYYAGKNAIVTGAASGIGLALSRKLLECGASGVLMADCNADNLDEQEQLLNQNYPGKVKGTVCDVTSEDDVKTMIGQGLDFFSGPLDLLINCAGIGHMGITVPIPDSESISRTTGLIPVTADQWREVFAVNFYGPLYGCRAALPVMLRQGKGQIVNIVSGTAFTPMPYQAVYSCSKAALNALTLVLRYEYCDYGVEISSATPGTTATGIYKGFSNIPSTAHSPEQAAVRILTGVAKNERLTAGDDDDLMGMFICNNPVYAEGLDNWTLNITRSRRIGNLSDYGLE